MTFQEKIEEQHVSDNVGIADQGEVQQTALTTAVVVEVDNATEQVDVTVEKSKVQGAIEDEEATIELRVEGNGHRNDLQSAPEKPKGAAKEEEEEEVLNITVITPEDDEPPDPPRSKDANVQASLLRDEPERVLLPTLETDDMLFLPLSVEEKAPYPEQQKKLRFAPYHGHQPSESFRRRHPTPYPQRPGKSILRPPTSPKENVSYRVAINEITKYDIWAKNRFPFS